MNTREATKILSAHTGQDVAPWAARLRRIGALPGPAEEMDGGATARLLLAVMAAPNSRDAPNVLATLDTLKQGGIEGFLTSAITQKPLPVLGSLSALLGLRRENPSGLACGLAVRHGGGAVIIYWETSDGEEMTRQLSIWGDRTGLHPPWAIVDQTVIDALAGRPFDELAAPGETAIASVTVH